MVDFSFHFVILTKGKKDVWQHGQSYKGLVK
jgi:hypothetical protein